MISSILTSFLARVLRIWKGRIFFFSLSKATASQSRMNDVVPGLQYCANKYYNPNNRKSYCLDGMHDVGVFLRVIFEISTVNVDGAVFQAMNLTHNVNDNANDVYNQSISYLSTLTIIFVLASEFHILESIQYFRNTFRRLCKHWAHRNS